MKICSPTRAIWRRLAEDVAYIAKDYGGDSEIDAQGRVLMPADTAARARARIAAGMARLLQRPD